jgi:hypothetical protein
MAFSLRVLWLSRYRTFLCSGKLGYDPDLEFHTNNKSMKRQMNRTVIPKSYGTHPDSKHLHLPVRYIRGTVIVPVLDFQLLQEFYSREIHIFPV